MNDPINKTLTVPLNTKDAFALFTQEIDTWWPKGTHSVKGAKTKISFAGHKDGEIIETDDEGQTHLWGTIIAYDPGRYLAFSWHPGRPPQEATVVTVTFTQTPDGAQCDLSHGGFDILGPTADAISTSYLHGWDMVLGCYTAAANTVVMA